MPPLLPASCYAPLLQPWEWQVPQPWCFPQFQKWPLTISLQVPGFIPSVLQTVLTAVLVVLMTVSTTSVLQAAALMRVTALHTLSAEVTVRVLLAMVPSDSITGPSHSATAPTLAPGPHLPAAPSAHPREDEMQFPTLFHALLEAQWQHLHNMMLPRHPEPLCFFFFLSQQQVFLVSFKTIHAMFPGFTFVSGIVATWDGSFPTWEGPAWSWG